MQIGPGSVSPREESHDDSLTYFEKELAQTIEDSIHECLEEDNLDHIEEGDDPCSE